MFHQLSSLHKKHHLSDYDILAPVQRLDSVIHRINLYPVVNAIGFPNTYLLDGDLSNG